MTLLEEDDLITDWAGELSSVGRPVGVIKTGEDVQGVDSENDKGQSTFLFIG